MVALALRRKTQMMTITRTMESSSSNSTSSTVARMVDVLSVMISTSTAPGREAWRAGSLLAMALATWITLAPGWRCTERMMACLSFCWSALPLCTV